MPGRPCTIYRLFPAAKQDTVTSLQPPERPRRQGAFFSLPPSTWSVRTAESCLVLSSPQVASSAHSPPFSRVDAEEGPIPGLAGTGAGVQLGLCLLLCLLVSIPMDTGLASSSLLSCHVGAVTQCLG